MVGVIVIDCKYRYSRTNGALDMFGFSYEGQLAKSPELMSDGHWYKFHQDAFYHRAVWKEKFALLPKRCALTDKLIWFRRGYQGTATWTGPGEPVYETRWHSRDEHLIWALVTV